ncbi:hypothetical protein IscW_ISCW008726 [Ixodes scapularis]|uniref:SAM domain-containing protein n=1 Tax=Ixodes scapularis TaxID=6945 RepID=B7Q1W7_IXOSC|nr:hypothetical protein IscW_ISCW008726 [Ixodes scapularis]|eukprot:XP_002410201.1 hypothetical protein IscW_ISCW008726 [Ixodes scapularis]
MKSSLVFRDQVAAMGSWFELWNPCEQTVGLYSLLRRLGPTQARFLALVLDRSLANCTELHQRERHANDPAYIERLSREPREQALGQLLGLLPLLSPGNQEAKAAYLSLIPQVLAHALDCRPPLLVEGARQLLSYSLIHPAISSRDDRRLLTLWLRHLEERISASRYQDHVAPMPDAPTPPNGSLVDPLGGGGGGAGGRPGSLDSWNTEGGFGALNGNYGPNLNGFGLSLGGAGGSLPPGLDSSHMALHPSNSVLSSSPFSPVDRTGSPLSQPTLKRSSSLTPPCSATNPMHQSQQQQQQGFGPGPDSGPPAAPVGGGLALCATPQRRRRRHRGPTPVAPEQRGLLGVRGTRARGRPSPIEFWPGRRRHEGPPSSPLEGSGAKVAAGEAGGTGTPAEPGGDAAEEDLPGLFTRLVGKGCFKEACFSSGWCADVPGWLKSLRLHKYAYLFANMSYDEMMNLTEDKLEAQNVTKGARHKIVLSIRKLKERPDTLRLLEKNLQEEGDIRTALVELRAMLQTPMKCSSCVGEGGDPRDGCPPSVAAEGGPPPRPAPSAPSGGSFSSSSSPEEEEEEESPPSSLDSSSRPSPPSSPLEGSGAKVAAGEAGGTGTPAEPGGDAAEEDLPGLFTRLVGKVCTNILVSLRTDDDCLNLFLMLVDKCLSHEAFSPTQKRRLFSWKQQVQKVWHPLPPRRSLDARHARGRWCGAPPPLVGGGDFGGPLGPLGGPSCLAPGPSRALALGAHPGGPVPPQAVGRAPLGRPPLAGLFFGGDVGGGGNPLAMVIKRPSLQEHLNKPHIQIQRTHSAPVRPSPVVAAASLYKQQVAAAAAAGRAADNSANDPEINNRLESLCLSVTEHALGGSGEELSLQFG